MPELLDVSVLPSASSIRWWRCGANWKLGIWPRLTNGDPCL